MPERKLRKIIAETRRATGGLGERYDESAAIALVKALGDCDDFVAPAFAYRHTPPQQRARQAFHRACTRLSTAIRQAVGHPGRPEHEARVVELVREMTEAVAELCSAFGWEGSGLEA